MANGISISPTKSPSSDLYHLVKDLYFPSLEAYACAAASIALTSCPVAIAIPSIPFIKPLLCVTALYVSEYAKANAYKIRSTPSGPPINSFVNIALHRAILLVE